MIDAQEHGARNELPPNRLVQGQCSSNSTTGSGSGLTESVDPRQPAANSMVGKRRYTFIWSRTFVWSFSLHRRESPAASCCWEQDHSQGQQHDGRGHRKGRRATPDRRESVLVDCVAVDTLQNIEIEFGHRTAVRFPSVIASGGRGVVNVKAEHIRSKGAALRHATPWALI